MESDTEKELVRDFCSICDKWINELFQNKALIEVEFSDADKVDLELSVALSWVIHVKQFGQLLKLWVLKVFQGDSELYWSVVAAVHFVQALIEISGPRCGHIWLEKASIAVTGRLIFLVDVGHIADAHLVGG